MKLVWAMVCSLLLAGTPFLPAQTVPSCASSPGRACCHGGGTMSCCRAQPVSGSQPAPAVPSPAGAQKQLSISAPASVAGALPENRTGLVSFAFRLPSMLNGAPLYARDCARLI
jgi:hypothetical protein